MVSFTPLPFYPRGKSPQYPLNRWLGGPQSRFQKRGEEKILDPIGARTPADAFGLILIFGISIKCNK
jgi:hypothetical protein